MIIVCRPMMDRDERRWLKADGDGDGQLTKAEFQAFLHPEDHYNMVDIVVLETLEDMDKDSDGAISEQEYIGDIYKVREAADLCQVLSSREDFTITEKSPTRPSPGHSINS